MASREGGTNARIRTRPPPLGLRPEGAEFYAVAVAPPAVGVYRGWHVLAREGARAPHHLQLRPFGLVGVAGRSNDIQGFQVLGDALDWLIRRSAQRPIAPRDRTSVVKLYL